MLHLITTGRFTFRCKIQKSNSWTEEETRNVCMNTFTSKAVEGHRLRKREEGERGEGWSDQQLSVSRRKVKGEGGYPPSRTRNSPVLSAAKKRSGLQVHSSICCNMCVVIGSLVIAQTFFAWAMTQKYNRRREIRPPSWADNFCSKQLFWLLSLIQTLSCSPVTFR